MKLLRVIGPMFILVLSFVAIAFPVSASGSTTVIKFQSKTAFADFDSVSPDGCIETFAFVDGTQSSTNPEADVFIGQYNNCTSTSLLSAYGSTSNPNFQVSGDLASASLNATISVFDYVSGNTFNVSVSTTWTATSPSSRNFGVSHYQTKGFRETFHFNDTFRDASASGTVSDGTTNFTPSSSVFAQTASFKSGDVTISHS
jgi:hypothetical protein